MKTVVLGGQRLGAGKKMTTGMKNYERSNHDRGSIIRTTMSAGTLVPFMVEYGLPGDTWDIDLETLVKTLPTTGPLFGSFKLQLDLFTTPVRLFNPLLHMNALGVGMDMANVHLPQMKIDGYAANKDPWGNWGYFDQSCLHAYLGIRGMSAATDAEADSEQEMFRNALPILTYYEIFKQYYANKMEDEAYVITPSISYGWQAEQLDTNADGSPINTITGDLVSDVTFNRSESEQNKIWITFMSNINELDVPLMEINGKLNYETNNNWYKITDLFEWSIDANFPKTLILTATSHPQTLHFQIHWFRQNIGYFARPSIKLEPFALSNIDDMRLALMQQPLGTPFILTKEHEQPYKTNFLNQTIPNANNIKFPNNYASQNGLCVKTYQSDIFNNWIKTGMVGVGSAVAEASKVAVQDGAIYMDSLQIAQKVYNLLNRIAASGGSYEDWSDAVYGTSATRRAETPVYCGGMSREIIFDEIVSTADVQNEEAGVQPLGTLAGKGTQSQKKKGGKIVIRIDEPSIIMGIVSITPRIDYCQGNKWFTKLQTMDDFHKPEFDGIGFQDLLTDQMGHWDAEQNKVGSVEEFKSAGQQPAWINYMTAYNETFGNFAVGKGLDFMVLNRIYERGVNFKDIKDLTTYIDPTKYNYAFAQTDLSSQNFMIQIAKDIMYRGVISAKIIPNL